MRPRAWFLKLDELIALGFSASRDVASVDVRYGPHTELRFQLRDYLQRPLPVHERSAARQFIEERAPKGWHVIIE